MSLTTSTPSDPKGKRRAMNISEITTSTDTSSRSTSLAIAMQHSLMLEQKLAQEAEESDTTESALQRMLSLRSVISTTSSFAAKQQAAVGASVEYREIGKGSIGVVFEHPGTTQCYKLPLLDNSDKLWNNYTVHTKVQEAFRHANTVLDINVEVPKMYWFANPTTAKFWDENLDKFPFDDQFPKKPRDALCMERVLPLPQPLRHHLIDKYCPKDKDAAKSYVPNRDCLVRPLLGRRRRGSGTLAFSLRNFRLHLDQFEELELNSGDYAIAMADAMAVLHAVAKIDAMDVEFVIGSSPSDPQTTQRTLSSKELENMKPGQSTFEMATAKDFTRRILCLWVLDFDACQPIEHNPTGAQAAVSAFMGTEAYCPRPSSHATGDRLWQLFGNRYKETCARFKVPPQFSAFFLNGVEVAVAAARTGRSESTTSSFVSGELSRTSTGQSSRGRGYQQLGQSSRSSGGSGRGSKKVERDMSGSWRK